MPFPLLEYSGSAERVTRGGQATSVLSCRSSNSMALPRCSVSPTLKKKQAKRIAGRQFMGEFSIFHWLVVLAIVLILFGGRKIPEVMKGLGEGTS